MLLILPIVLSRISHHYSLFIPILSPIILYYSSNLIVSLVKLHMAAAKIVYFSAIKIDNIINSSYEVALLLSYSSSDYYLAYFITFTQFSSQ